MPLRAGAQLILQAEQTNGMFTCEGFVGLPLFHPVFVAIASAGTPTAQRDVADLYQAFLRNLHLLAPQLQRVSMPCPGIVPNPAFCHALGEHDCEKVLVLVGDPTHPMAEHSFAAQWLQGDPTYRVLPVFAERTRKGVAALLPTAYRHLNVAFWSHTIDEVVPTLLALGGVVPENPRIFISYRQADTAALAIQLFDALAHAGFDVFLDHFRIPPGVNFQARLTQELGDKAMVLLLESAHILDSEWTIYEISVAKTAGLGIIALHVPSGLTVDGVDAAVRITPPIASFASTGELNLTALTDVVSRVREEHARALVRRRQILRDSLEGALLEQGVTIQSVTPGGLRFVGANGREYLVWLTPRPPELPDFHGIHGHVAAPATGVVIGLARLMEPTRLAQTDWLANLCGVRLVDEGHLRQAAARIAAGTL
jgi:hypothetical protein